MTRSQSWATERDGLGVVVPTLNCERFLSETLESLRRVSEISQIIVSDSGSTDGTLDIVKAAGVELLHDAPPGLYPALNAGLHRLTTPWMTYINGDDLLNSRGIAELFSHRHNHDVLYGPVDFVDADGAFLHCWHSATPRQILPLFRVGISPLLQQGTLFRRSLFTALDGFRECWSFVSDADFWWRAAESNARFGKITSPPVARFRLHPNQLSQVHANRMDVEYREMAASHGARRSPAAGWWPRASYRLSRWRSYLVRYLRQADLTGRTRLTGSYDVR